MIFKKKIVLFFFKDEKENKVYNVVQLMNLKYPKSKIIGFNVENLKNDLYRLAFFIEEENDSENKYYYRFGVDNFNPKNTNQKIFQRIDT